MHTDVKIIIQTMYKESTRLGLSEIKSNSRKMIQTVQTEISQNNIEII